MEVIQLALLPDSIDGGCWVPRWHFRMFTAHEISRLHYSHGDNILKSSAHSKSLGVMFVGHVVVKRSHGVFGDWPETIPRPATYQPRWCLLE